MREYWDLVKQAADNFTVALVLQDWCLENLATNDDRTQFAKIVARYRLKPDIKYRNTGWWYSMGEPGSNVLTAGGQCNICAYGWDYTSHPFENMLTAMPKHTCNWIELLESRADKDNHPINPEIPRPILRNEYQYHLDYGHKQGGEDWSRLIEWADLYGTDEQQLMARALGRYKLRYYYWGWNCWYRTSTPKSYQLMDYDYVSLEGKCKACTHTVLLSNGKYDEFQTWLTAKHNNHDHLADLEEIHKDRLNPEIQLLRPREAIS